ncbi:hypothetical protein MMC16_006232 [Acarospora aff. strigata]|nr:hypothetical protein [Acarospora aff. strigata]
MAPSKPTVQMPNPTILAGNRIFLTIDEAIDYVNGLPDEVKYDWQCEIAQDLMRSTQMSDTLVETFFEYVQEDKSWERAVDKKTFMEEWSSVIEVSTRVKTERNRQREAKNAIIKEWGNAAEDIIAPMDTYHLLAAVRKCARARKLKDALLGVNQSIVERVQSPRRGHSTTVAPLASDFDKATKGQRRFEPLSVNTLLRNNLCMGRNGILKKGHVDESLQGVKEASGSGKPSPKHGEQGIEGPIDSVNEIEPPLDEDTPLIPIITSINKPGSTSIKPRTDNTPSTQGIGGVIKPGLIPHSGNTPSNIESEENGDTPINIESEENGDTPINIESEENGDTPINIGSEEEFKTFLNHELRGTGIIAIFEATGPITIEKILTKPPSHDPPPQTGCFCSADVPQTWKITVQQRGAYALSKGVRLLKQMFRNGWKVVCLLHLMGVAYHLGMRTKHLSHQELYRRLLCLHQHPYIGFLKAQLECAHWFRRKHRQPIATDDLGPYRFRTVQLECFWYCPGPLLDGFDVKKREILKDGVVQVERYYDSLEWLRKDSFETTGVRTSPWDVIQYEFDMYRHHARRLDKKNDQGWLKTMLHSLGQQLMRQDPFRYLVVCHNRTDNWWRQVSYPYYTKQKSHHDGIYFQELGVETSSHERYKQLAMRSNNVYKSPDVFLERSEEGINRSDRAIALETIEPGLIGLQPDLELLERPEMATWTQLSKAHVSLEALHTSATKDGSSDIPYRFPAAIELSGISALSDALICRRRWDSPEVLIERDILLGGDRRRALEYVFRWRCRARHQIIKVFDKMRTFEDVMFGKDSFYVFREYRLDRLVESDDEMTTEHAETDDEMITGDDNTDKPKATEDADTDEDSEVN